MDAVDEWEAETRHAYIGCAGVAFFLMRVHAASTYARTRANALPHKSTDWVSGLLAALMLLRPSPDEVVQDPRKEKKKEEN
jgi:hypothetical protein